MVHPDRLLYQASRQIKEKFNLQHIFVFLINESDSTLSLQTREGAFSATRLSIGQKIHRGDDIYSMVINSAQPKIIFEPGEATLPLPAQIPTTQSYAVFPMRARDKVLGIISMHSQTPIIIEPDELIALQILVDQITILLANAQLFSERAAAIEAER